MNRKVYFDYMRVFAIFNVVILHICAYRWYELDINSAEWLIVDTYNSIVRWAVPTFIMISGALFLGREIPIKTIYSKYIFRIITAFIFWTLVYALFSNEPLFSKFKQIIQGYYHMWFLFLIVGMYISVPILKCIIRDEKLTKYFLLVSFIVAFILPTITQLANSFGPEISIKTMESINTDLINMSINSFLGMGFYYVLGYYIDNKLVEIKHKVYIYVLGFLGLLLTVLLSYTSTKLVKVPQSGFYSNYQLNVLFYSVAAFLLIKNLFKNGINEKIDKFVGRIAKYSFGIYLVHVLIIEQLESICGINGLSYQPIIFIPILALIIFVIACIISAVINHIPILRKYIV